jgi:hypothetical protein
MQVLSKHEQRRVHVLKLLLKTAFWWYKMLLFLSVFNLTWPLRPVKENRWFLPGSVQVLD